MRTIKHGIWFIASVAALSLLPIQLNAKVVLKELGTLGGDTSSASGINEFGEIVGVSAASDGTTHGFRWQNGLMSNLDPHNSNQCQATAINDAGQIVGNFLYQTTNYLTVSNIGLFPFPVYTNVANGVTNYYTITISSQPFLLNRGSLNNQELGTNGVAFGINDSGQIVGVSGSHAFVYSKGLMTDLGALLGGFGSVAHGINNRGEIVGESDINLTNLISSHPFLYSHGLMHDLGSLGGTIAAATAINDLGEIVGSSTTTSNLEQHPFLYRDGKMYDLGTLGGSSPNPSLPFPVGGQANAINNWGQIVGESISTNGAHAFLYSKGKMTDLNNLVNLTAINSRAGFLVLTAATGINDIGQVVGTGLFWDGTKESSRAFLLELTPEY
jgi:probable HAF family extracellular repeat protein